MADVYISIRENIILALFFVQEKKTKKSLAQEVRQKSDISERRSKG